MSDIGSGPDQITRQAMAANTASFKASLVLNAVVFGAEILIFTLVRRRFPAIYEPRTYAPIESKRQKPLATSLLGWPAAIFKADHKEIQHHNGMDAYFYVRFLRMMARIMLPIWIVSWAVLLPIHAVPPTRGLGDSLDTFTFGNVAATQQRRYIAHIILVYIFTGWIFYNIKTEMREFVITRQRHLVDPIHSASAQANTILITGVPRKFLDEGAIARLFRHLPGGVKKVWLNRDLKDLPDIYDRRLKACDKLESAETTLIETALKLHRKGQSPVTAGEAEAGTDRKEQIDFSATADKYVPRDQRPTHRLPVLGFLPFGKKVDTIDWCKQEIAETTQLLETGRAILNNDKDAVSVHGDVSQSYPPLNSVFILFNQQIAAHLAAQSLTHNEPYRMSDKYTEIAPADVIWSNLGLNPYEQKVRQAISYALTAGLIILWAIPVSFVGIISSIGNVCADVSWLSWICRLPEAVVGIISGILPPVLLAVLMMLLPIILRLLAHFEGIPRRTGLELSLMTRFFIFQVIHSFLVVTLSGGLIQSIPSLISNPTSIPSILAQNLPKASTFFLTYAVLQALAGTAGGLLQIVPLVVYYVMLFLLGSTPRSIYKIKYDLRDVAWGTLFPATTLLVVITFGYMVISPIINGLACAAFFLFYQVWKYLFLWQFDQPASGDTGGLFFPKAITHMFVGLYVQQVCLAALFFLARDESSNASAFPQGILMIILIVATAFFHMIILNSYSPLYYSLPLTLADKSYGMPQYNEGGEESLNGKDGKDGSVKIGRDDGGDFGGDPKPNAPEADHVPSPEEVYHEKAAKERAAYIEAVGPPADVGEIQAVSGPHATQVYGDSVPVEGKRNEGPTDFNHPASVEPQRIIWIPRDPLGVAVAEEVALKTAGIEVSIENATVDEKGNVEIQSHPPGMDPSTIFG